MLNLILAVQILVSSLLVVLILMQAKGTGFGRAFGGGSSSSFTRRGLEKVIFKLTFVISFIFIAISILQFTV
jgi:protein translocase SecG subunit